MNAIVLILGLVILGGGLAGIFLVTIPSVYGVAEGAGETAEGAVDLSKEKDGTTKIVSGVGKAVLSGIILWITTGIFVALIIGGFVVTIFGAVM